jgi:hypothetical protein
MGAVHLLHCPNCTVELLTGCQADADVPGLRGPILDCAAEIVSLLIVTACPISLSRGLGMAL